MLSAHLQIILAGWLANFAVTIHAANPILPGYADPAVRVWDGRAHLAVGKAFSPTAKGFAMPDWAGYSSTIKVDWGQEKSLALPSSPTWEKAIGAVGLRITRAI